MQEGQVAHVFIATELQLILGLRVKLQLHEEIYRYSSYRRLQKNREL
jgi:hypothetical protein